MTETRLADTARVLIDYRLRAIVWPSNETDLQGQSAPIFLKNRGSDTFDFEQLVHRLEGAMLCSISDNSLSLRLAYTH